MFLKLFSSLSPSKITSFSKDSWSWLNSPLTCIDPPLVTRIPGFEWKWTLAPLFIDKVLLLATPAYPYITYGFSFVKFNSFSDKNRPWILVSSEIPSLFISKFNVSIIVSPVSLSVYLFG